MLPSTRFDIFRSLITILFLFIMCACPVVIRIRVCRLCVGVLFCNYPFLVKFFSILWPGVGSVWIVFGLEIWLELV